MGKYKNGRPNQETSVEDLRKALENGDFINPLMDKSYLVVLFWVGCRRTEPLGMVKEDITLEGSSLFLKIVAKKHGARGGLVELPLSWVGVELLKKR